MVRSHLPSLSAYIFHEISKYLDFVDVYHLQIQLLNAIIDDRISPAVIHLDSHNLSVSTERVRFVSYTAFFCAYFFSTTLSAAFTPTVAARPRNIPMTNFTMFLPSLLIRFDDFVQCDSEYYSSF